MRRNFAAGYKLYQLLKWDTRVIERSFIYFEFQSERKGRRWANERLMP